MTQAAATRYAIVLAGCGKMGGALLGGWIEQGTAPESVLVVEPNDIPLPAGVTRVAAPADIPPGVTAEVVVLAVKPQVMPDVLPAYARFVDGGAVFLSIAAGRSISFFRGLLGETAAVVRAMPNTPAAIGRGMTVLCAGPGVDETQKTFCMNMVSGVGLAAWIEDEALMDAVTGVSGSGPAYVFYMVEAMAKAGEAMGLPADLAMMLARQTVSGAGELLNRSPEPAEQLRRNVTSPGGTTAAALEVLMHPEGGLTPLMEKAVAAATRRGRELAG